MGLLLLALALPTLVGVASGAAAPKPLGTASASVNVQWNATPTNLSQGFWGADVRVFSAVGSDQVGWWKDTPLTVARWPGGAVTDGYNYTTNVETKTGGGSYTPPQDEAQFIQWCEQVHCEAIFGVPAEIDQPATAAFYVAYTEQTLHFHPAYWEIGNEPAQWRNFDQPWSKWASGANSIVTAEEYAQVVHSYIAAMRAVDPTIRIIGLPGTGIGSTSEATWLSDTVQLNGPNLSAVAIHVYSAGSGNGTPTLPGFFASLTGKGSLLNRVPADRSAIGAACPKCGTIPIFVTEFGSGNGGGKWDGYMKTYPNVPYIAASLLQGIALGVSNIDLFAFQSTYPGSLYTGSGVESPLGELYGSVLPELGDLYVPTSVSSPIQDVYGAATLNEAGTQAALLVVNANATSSVTIPLWSAGVPRGGPAEEIVWNQTASGPTSWVAPQGVGSTLTIPAASLALVRVPTHSGSSTPAEYPVTFSESGLSSGSAWSVQIDSQTIPTTSPNVGTVMVNGSYPYTIIPPASYQASPDSGTVVVDGRSVNVSIDFAPVGGRPSTYPVEFVPQGLPATIPWGIDLGGIDANGMGTLTAFTPNGSYSYAVDPLSGFTPSPSTGTVSVNGQTVQIPISFTANATGTGAGNYSVTFRQSGLGPGTSWWVALKNDPALNVTSDGPTVSLSLPNGSYQYVVGADSGYVPTSATGAFSVVGAGSTIVVAFEHLNSSSKTPPALYGLIPPLSPTTLNAYVIGVVGAVAIWLIGMVDFFVIRLASAPSPNPRARSRSWSLFPPRAR